MTTLMSSAGRATSLVVCAVVSTCIMAQSTNMNQGAVVPEGTRANRSLQSGEANTTENRKPAEERKEARLLFRSSGTVVVNYGLPSPASRPEFVLNTIDVGEYWTLGTGRATRLDTDTDLKFGNTIIGNGRYLLRARKTKPGSWVLTINRVKAKEIIGLAEVPMALTRMTNPVKALTIELKADDTDKAKFTVLWGTVNASAEFQKAQDKTGRHPTSREFR